MNFANEFDIATWVYKFDQRRGGNTPNLERASIILDRLATWTDNNSDGWAYWPKPCRAASKLIEEFQAVDNIYFHGDTVSDMTDQELTKALTPIKAFLTRQGVTHSEVIV